MIRLIMFLCILSIAYPVGAKDCDCTIFPFKPPSCVDKCIAKSLAVANAEELENIAGVDARVAQMIEKIPTDQRPSTLEGYRKFLPQGAFEQIKASMLYLSEDEFSQLRKAAEDRGVKMEKDKLW